MLFAGSAGAGLVAANFWGGTDVLLDWRVVIVAVVAVGAMHMAGCVMIVVMVAVGTVDMGDSGLNCVVHGDGPAAGLTGALGELTLKT